MHDLRLWRLLRAGEPSPADLIPLLQELAGPPLAVRREALADLAGLPAWHALYLLPDDACRDRALALLDGQTAPPAVLPLVFEYLHRGLLTRPLARGLVAGVGLADWLKGLSRWPQ